MMYFYLYDIKEMFVMYIEKIEKTSDEWLWLGASLFETKPKWKRMGQDILFIAIPNCAKDSLVPILGTKDENKRSLVRLRFSIESDVFVILF